MLNVGICVKFRFPINVVINPFLSHSTLLHVHYKMLNIISTTVKFLKSRIVDNCGAFANHLVLSVDPSAHRFQH